MNIQPYLSFEGRAQEAIDFYKSAVGATENIVMRFKDAPPEVQAQISPGMADKVMHASVKLGPTILMMSDDCMSPSVTYNGFRLCLTGNDVAHGEKLYNALAESGQVNMPWQATFWTKGFGMVTDKFGIGWMVMAPEMPDAS